MLPLRDTADSPRIPRRKGYFRLFFTIAVSLLAVWFLWDVISHVGLRELWDRIRGADRSLLAIAVGLTILRFPLLALRWEVLVRREAPVGFRQITPVLMAGNFLSTVTPVLRVAGPVLRAFYLSKETGRPRARFYGTIVADQASNFTVYAVAISVGGVMVRMPDRFQISLAGGAGMLIALVAGLSVAYVMLRQLHHGRPSRVAGLLKATLGEGAPGGWRSRFVSWWEDLFRALSASVVGTGAWWPSLLLSLVVFAIVVAVQILTLASVGARIGVAEASFAVAGAGFIQVMGAAPGGPGVTEASLIAVLTLALGLDEESSMAGVLLARFVSYAVLLPWGGYCFFNLQRRYGMPRNGAGELAA